MSDLTIADDFAVALAYRLTLEDGEVVDETEKGDDFWYLHGHDNIIPGLEIALTGLKVGDKRTVTVAPANAYGEYDPEAFHFVPYDAFPEDMDLEEGMALTLQNSETNELVEAYIAELQDDGVVIDMNHPLAGERLTFDVEVLAIRPATKDELAHGHVHSPGHHHH